MSGRKADLKEKGTDMSLMASAVPPNPALPLAFSCVTGKQPILPEPFVNSSELALSPAARNRLTSADGEACSWAS